MPLDLADDWDDLDDEERAERRESLRASIEHIKAGQTMSIAQALAELRAHRRMFDLHRVRLLKRSVARLGG